MTVAIDRDIGKRIQRLAKRLGMTMFSLTNQILYQGIKVFEESGARVDLYDLWIREKAKEEVGLIFVDSNAFAKSAYHYLKSNPEEAKNTWRKWGEETSLYLKREYLDLNSACEAIKKIFTDIKEVYVEELGDNRYLLHVSLPLQLTRINELIVEWYKGFLKMYNFEIIKTEFVGSTYTFTMRRIG